MKNWEDFQSTLSTKDNNTLYDSHQTAHEWAGAGNREQPLYDEESLCTKIWAGVNGYGTR